MSAAPPISPHVMWHLVECGRYAADLPLWRELAAAAPDGVLDVGAGTGRVALDLAAAGHEVVALDHDPELLEALSTRAARSHLEIETLVADAQDFDAGAERFALVLVPMQTVQLLDDRPAFLRAARRGLHPGGLLAIAIAEDLDPFDPEPGLLPDPDIAILDDGTQYVSQPTAVRIGDGWSRIERVRTVVRPDGRRSSEPNAIDLALLDAATLAQEGRAAGLTSVPGERVDPTPDHVGSSVVLFRA
jgi:SAM-dependent methyltransferase